jgi:lycopene beta-cyclase
LSDSNYDKAWPPNYGLWLDEWQSVQQLYESFGRTLSQDDNIDTQWDVTDCYFGGSFDIPMEERLRVDRPYVRVDKEELQSSLSPPPGQEDKKTSGWYRVLRANHVSEATSVNLFKPSQSLRHDETGSTITLQPKDGEDLVSVRAKLIVDCTGHETKLIIKEGRPTSPPPGFQIAYGVLTKINESAVSDKTRVGPYSKEAMTLFDYRTDHFDDDPEWKQKAQADPTFMYAMPIQDNEMFFEETSLVARPAVSFQECKDRCFKRLKYLGIEVEDILEEEFCYIPMGGPLPAKDQRIIAFGGSAAMAHPSTGYNLARNMMGAGAAAKAIQEGLGSDKEGDNLDKVAASAYNAIWSPANIRQRNFAVFGGDFLMAQNVEGLRGFFDGFFRIPMETWGGFLAGWPGLPNNDKHETWSARLLFGLTFVSKLQWQISLKLVTAIATYSIKDGPPLIQSVTPLFGEPESFEYIPRPKSQGDVAAKREAWNMIQESKVEEEMPNSFVEFKAGNEVLTKVEK